ncbi:diguanylate cyclase domain-containing protein [Pseudomonas mangiferae]|uniref:Diguanylate cyclase n=1 Tax=Pseudomonas mangiferae TaxID=2593654 RepID=A0A553H1C3_9PSED|nr:diguanylate cyclase [Pseudomonas mangiferae]TRX75523.1 diguanylate cyclase [Pseudomonas mangiferae]
MLSSHSLRTRFALFIALLAVTLCTVLGSTIYHDSSTRIRKAVGRQLADLSYQMVERLDRDMANRARMLDVLGSLNALRDPKDPQQIRVLLDRMKTQFKSVAWTGYMDPSGQVLASTDGLLQGANIAQRPVFSEGLKGRFVGDVHEAVLLAKLLPNPTGEAMKFVDISLPITGTDERTIVGVLGTHLSWAWAEEVRTSLMLPQQDRDEVEFFVLAKDGTVLLGPRESIGQDLDLPVVNKPTDTGWAVQAWPDQRDYLTAYARSQGNGDYQGLGWVVVARQPLDVAYAPAYEMRRDTLKWGAILALLCGFVGWLVAALYTRPLRDIAQAADRISSGQIAVIPEVGGSSEIHSLSRSIRNMVENLTQQEYQLGEMESLAHHDALTGLPNRNALGKYLRYAQQRNRSEQDCLALLYVDLDGFKPVNDRYGHAAGDLLLKEVAVRLRGCLREGDLVARLGGDEFVMALQVHREHARPQSAQIASRVLNSLREPVVLAEGVVTVGCSIGGALWPQDSFEMSAVMELADQALYRAKAAGRNRAEFHGD